MALIGAPTDLGAGHRGGAMGPEALRVAGLEAALHRQGMAVIDRADLSGPPRRRYDAPDGSRHLSEVAAWCELAHDAVYQSLAMGELPILLGGDHSLAIGSVAAAARHCAETDRPLSVLWLDAHADFNTPESSPSGNLHGMPAAAITGRGDARLTGLGPATPMLDAAHIVQIGIRSVDAAEQLNVMGSGLVVYDMRQIAERGMGAVMSEALAQFRRRGGHLHVSLDVDFLDPSIAPGVGTTVAGGPKRRDAQLCMAMVRASGLVGSLDIVELNPALDVRNRTATLVVELVAELLGEEPRNHRRAER